MDRPGGGLPDGQRGTPWLTQSRPITTLFPLPAEPHGGLHVYLSINIAQGVYRPITPMGAATLALMFNNLMRNLGIPTDGPQPCGDRRTGPVSRALTRLGHANSKGATNSWTRAGWRFRAKSPPSHPPERLLPSPATRSRWSTPVSAVGAVEGVLEVIVQGAVGRALVFEAPKPRIWSCVNRGSRSPGGV